MIFSRLLFRIATNIEESRLILLISYQNIKLEIEKMITKKFWMVGQKLPSENELAKYFNVSRETLRAAIKLLEQEGKVLVKHGIGTFVINPLPNNPSRLDILQSVGAMIEFAGLTEGEKLVMIDEVPCNKEWGAALKITEGVPCVKVERIRLGNGEPVAYSINILPKHLVGDVFDRVDFSGSVFDFLKRECKIHITKADTELLVPLKKDKFVLKLQVDEEEVKPVFLMKQLHIDEQNKEVLYSLDYLRSDIFKFWIRRERK